MDKTPKNTGLTFRISGRPDAFIASVQDVVEGMSGRCSLADETTVRGELTGDYSEFWTPLEDWLYEYVVHIQGEWIRFRVTPLTYDSFQSAKMRVDIEFGPSESATCFQELLRAVAGRWTGVRKQLDAQMDNGNESTIPISFFAPIPLFQHIKTAAPNTGKPVGQFVREVLEEALLPANQREVQAQVEQEVTGYG